LTIDLFSAAIPDGVAKSAKDAVSLNDLFLVFFHVDQKSLVNESWVFIPDPKIIFHRLSEQESFDPGMTPNGSIVCCEIMSGKDRPLGGMTDDALCAAAITGLHDMGYQGFQILGQRVVRLPKSYPVFQVGYEKGLADVLHILDRVENFRSIGRQGAFNYIGTLDAMDIGYGIARWLVGGREESWEKERDRTNHYPVLD
jgi:protoporphyrinogen oxidase